MVLNHCTTCTVYEPGDSIQTKIQVKCEGERIILFSGKAQELSDTSSVRIDFFDSQKGRIRTNCKIVVRKNEDQSISSPWTADCEIQEVIEIVESRRSVRTAMEKEAVFTVPGKDDFRGVIQNISEGGIYFIAETRLQRNDTVMFSYCFVEKECEMEVVILREEELDDGHYGYGCQFLEMTVDAQKDIRQYVSMRRQGMVS